MLRSDIWRAGGLECFSTTKTNQSMFHLRHNTRTWQESIIPTWTAGGVCSKGYCVSRSSLTYLRPHPRSEYVLLFYLACIYVYVSVCTTTTGCVTFFPGFDFLLRFCFIQVGEYLLSMEASIIRVSVSYLYLYIPSTVPSGWIRPGDLARKNGGNWYFSESLTNAAAHEHRKTKDTHKWKNRPKVCSS